MPQEIINKLRLKQGDKLVIECKTDGFIVCKVEEYRQTLMDKFDKEWYEADAELKHIFKKLFSKSLNSSDKKDNKTEVL